MSRLYKAINDIPEKDQKIIRIKTFDHGETGPELRKTPAHTEEQIQQLLMNAQNEAEQMIHSARQEVSMLEKHMNQERESLQQEKHALFEQAQSEGFAAGYEEGRQQGYNDYAEYIALAKQTVDISKKDYETTVDQADRTILQIGMKVAGKIINEELTANEEHYLTYVIRALKEAREQSDVQLHVHPTQYELLVEHKDELMAVFPKETKLYIFPNDELAETSCVIESDSGRIDAAVDSQLNEIKVKLFEKLESDH
ncbi:flagellar assembly protein FliH [Cytobacillus gottheilii]|uniref:flagellar assembly protein FliH n=1 Tax=Cytobacillus gottheilii TaxID=859144 RepID=UPI001592EB17|nr:flagellar assembly protein FliH [Cytobacillus gottheilii]